MARPQHVMRGLANRGWDIVYVDPPVTWLGPLKQPRLWRHVRPRPELTNAEPGISLLRLPAIWPFGNMQRTINRWNQQINGLHIRRALLEVRRTRPVILYSFLPGAVDLLSVLRSSYVIYDCVDDHASFDGLIRPNVINTMEKELAHKSNTVFATAMALLQKMQRVQPEAMLLPNGAEIQHFRHARHVPEHPRLANIPKPRLGFYGGLGAWIDFELLRHTAKALPEASIVLIGPKEASMGALQGMDNVYWLDRQPYGELPAYLAGFDVTLAPFRRTVLTESLNPIKVYEYLAAGREVVATVTAETVRLSDVIWLADSADEFVEQIRAVLNGAQKASEDVRNGVVFENSWINRVEKIHGRLMEVFPDALT